MHEVIDHQNQDRASARLIHALVVLERNLREKVILGLTCSLLHGCLDVLGELGREDDVVVQSVFYEFSASLAAVPIEHTEDLDFRPVSYLGLLGGRLDHVQNNSNAILISFADSANISISCEGAHSAKALSGYFGGLELLQCR